jgi:fucose permease
VAAAHRDLAGGLRRARRHPAAPGREPSRTGLFATALRTPAVLLGAAFLAVYVGLEIGVGSWGFSFLADDRSVPALIAGYTISGYWLGLTLGRFVISPLASRLGLNAVAMTFGCLGGVIASCVLIWAAPVTAMESLGFVLLGFWLGPLFPTTMAIVPSLVAARLVPAAIGVMNGLSVLGGAGLPWFAGLLGQRVGIWTLIPLALVLAVGLVVIWRLLTGRMTPELAAEA